MIQSKKWIHVAVMKQHGWDIDKVVKFVGLPWTDRSYCTRSEPLHDEWKSLKHNGDAFSDVRLVHIYLRNSTASVLTAHFRHWNVEVFLAWIVWVSLLSCASVICDDHILNCFSLLKTVAPYLKEWLTCSTFDESPMEKKRLLECLVVLLQIRGVAKFIVIFSPLLRTQKQSLKRIKIIPFVERIHEEKTVSYQRQNCPNFVKQFNLWSIKHLAIELESLHKKIPFTIEMEGLL